MNQKFTAFRNPENPSSNIIGQLQKRSGDKFLMSVDYQKVLQEDDYISSCVVDILKISDDSDVTGTMYESFVSGNLVAGDATGGSTSTLIDTTKNFSALGVEQRDVILNVTKAQRMIVKNVSKTTNVGDTISFATQLLAAESGDDWKALFCTCYIKAGDDGSQYLATFTSTSNFGSIFVDTILVHVKD